MSSFIQRLIVMIKFRKAKIEDSKIYFDWANDTTVREQSYNSNAIVWGNHNNWFTAKMNDTTCLMLVFQDEQNNNIGQVRIQKENDTNALIGLSVDSEHRGKGYAKEMLQSASDFFLMENPYFCIDAYIKEQNLNSKFAFEKAGFQFLGMTICEGYKSFHYIKRINENR